MKKNVFGLFLLLGCSVLFATQSLAKEGDKDKTKEAAKAESKLKGEYNKKKDVFVPKEPRKTVEVKQELEVTTLRRMFQKVYVKLAKELEQANTAKDKKTLRKLRRQALSKIRRKSKQIRKMVLRQEKEWKARTRKLIKKYK